MWFGRCRQLTKPISRMILDKINLVSLSLCHQELDTTEILHLRLAGFFTCETKLYYDPKTT